MALGAGESIHARVLLNISSWSQATCYVGWGWGRTAKGKSDFQERPWRSVTHINGEIKGLHSIHTAVKMKSQPLLFVYCAVTELWWWVVTVLCILHTAQGGQSGSGFLFVILSTSVSLHIKYMLLLDSFFCDECRMSPIAPSFLK